MKEIIQTKQLSKSYDQRMILYKIDLRIEKGRSIAFTGHNGCGKSTMLKLLAGLDGLTRAEAAERCERLMEDFFMEEMGNTQMKNLSKGTLQKVGVIQALLTVPQVLLLDEPLSGQDADSQDVFISKIKELHQQGMTILMSCHEQHLIDRISDTVYHIEKGRIAYD